MELKISEKPEIKEEFEYVRDWNTGSGFCASGSEWGYAHTGRIQRKKSDLIFLSQG